MSTQLEESAKDYMEQPTPYRLVQLVKHALIVGSEQGVVDADPDSKNSKESLLAVAGIDHSLWMDEQSVSCDTDSPYVAHKFGEPVNVGVVQCLSCGVEWGLWKPRPLDNLRRVQVSW